MFTGHILSRNVSEDFYVDFHTRDSTRMYARVDARYIHAAHKSISYIYIYIHRVVLIKKREKKKAKHVDPDRIGSEGGKV